MVSNPEPDKKGNGRAESTPSCIALFLGTLAVCRAMRRSKCHSPLRVLAWT